VADRAAIGLGSNLGDKAGNIERAVGRMRQLGDVTAVSTIYQTAPIGGPDQPVYYNAVVLLNTDLEPRALLDGLLDIERAQGRERTERWGPRIIDLDVLLFADEEIDQPGLIVPHPRMTERRFVLEPLLEVWPDATLPDGSPLKPKLADVADQRVQPLAPVGVSPRTAGLVLFLTVGMLSVGIWWLVDWLLS
jgi:2-amino-4-hydroxy-6-hydroxymethyldihydropteridine diphosphokinase